MKPISLALLLPASVARADKTLTADLLIHGRSAK